MALSTRLGIFFVLAASLGVAFLFSAPVQAQDVNALRDSVKQSDACILTTKDGWEYLSPAEMLERLDKNPDIRQGDFKCDKNRKITGFFKLDRRVDGGGRLHPHRGHCEISGAILARCARFFPSQRRGIVQRGDRAILHTNGDLYFYKNSCSPHLQVTSKHKGCLSLKQG